MIGRSLDAVWKLMLVPWRTRNAAANGSAAKRKGADPHISYRKCPKCGERDYRLSDRQRSKPEVYRSRVFLLKWLCLACGYRENETIEETE